MTELETDTRRELAHRSNAGIDVTLVWERRGGEERAVVCVCDTRGDVYFEIQAESYLALDVYYHPFAYRDFSTSDHEDRRFAA